VASSKDRERELARQRYERQLQRRAAAQAKARQRLMVGLTVGSVVVIIAVVVLISVLGGSKKSTSGASAAAQSATPSAGASGAPSSSASASSAAATPSVKATVAGGKPLTCTTPPAKPAKPLSFSSEPPVTIDKTATYTATITTNCGVIKATLDAAKAPHTVNSFAFLAGKGYFTDVPCHRLTTSGIYVLQCGDPTGTGSGGPGYKFTDENLKGATYGTGVLAMANAGANTNGSQFFINYKDSQLPANYTPFGKVTQGLDIVQAIGAEGASGGSGDGAPNQPVSILKFTITKSS
jgi:peptidyl-prolyl cis-trans isomerase B (cyclophilin B)